MALKFGIISDIQYCDKDPEYNRFFRQSLEKAKEAITTFNNTSLDFVLNLGDTIDERFESFTPVIDLIDSINHPIYHLLGNHDFKIDKKHINQVYKVLNLDNPYYSIVYKDFKIICLNGTQLHLNALPDNHPLFSITNSLIKNLINKEAANAQYWNGGIHKDQLIWLEKELEASKLQNQNVIIACHYPIYPKTRYNLWNDDELLNLILKHKNVICWLNGHCHAGNYAQLEHIHFINFKGMVEHEKLNTYATIEVNNQTIKINGFGIEDSRELNIC